MQKFVTKYGLSFPQVNDGTSDVYAHFEVPAQPAWVFVDPAGQTSQVLGALEESQLDQILAGISKA